MIRILSYGRQSSKSYNNNNNNNKILKLPRIFIIAWLFTIITTESSHNNHYNNNNIVSSIMTQAIQINPIQPQRSRKLIINGTIAPYGRYPYFVSLNHLCGGALIAPDIVLTAGHCKGREHKYARIGTYTLPKTTSHTNNNNRFHNYHHQNQAKNNDVDDDTTDANHNSIVYEYEEIRIIEQVRHPSFQWLGDDEFVHDFLLLKLQHLSSLPIITINSHSHIPKPNIDSNSNTNNNNNVIAMGMGNTNPDYESKSNILMEVPLSTIPNDICEESFDNNRNISYLNRIHPSMICTTGGNNNERDACAYDSGSPIIVPGDTFEDDILVALVSWGEECADPQFPGVNARISDGYDWIRANVCAMSNYPPDEMCRNIMNIDSDDNVLTTTSTTSNLFNTDSWLTQSFLILCIILCILMMIDRFFCSIRDWCCCKSKNNKYYDIDNDNRDTPTIIDEMTKLKRHRSWTKMRSYDSGELLVDTAVPSAA